MLVHHHSASHVDFLPVAWRGVGERERTPLEKYTAGPPEAMDTRRGRGDNQQERGGRVVLSCAACHIVSLSLALFRFCIGLECSHCPPPRHPLSSQERKLALLLNTHSLNLIVLHLHVNSPVPLLLPVELFLSPQRRSKKNSIENEIHHTVIPVIILPPVVSRP